MQIKNIARNNWQIILIIGLFAYIVISGNRRENIDFNYDRIDSIVRTIKIPKDTIMFKDTVFKPTYNNFVTNNNLKIDSLNKVLLEKFKSLENNDSILKAYMDAIAVKVYKKKYKDSLIKVTVIDTLQGGKLFSQDVKVELEEREINYYEKTVYKYPKYSITAGLDIHSVLDQNNSNRAQVFPVLGFRGSKGWEFNLGANVLNLKEFKVGIKKDIFTKYSNKDPK